MSQQSIKVDAGTGSAVDFSQTSGGNYRQAVTIGDPTTDANYVTVANGAANVVGTVAISGTPAVTISGTPTVTLGTGSNVIGTVSLSAGAITLGAASNVIGSVSITGALPTGTNALGSVTLGAANNIIGSVTVVGAIPAGSNSIGSVTLGSANNIIGSVTVVGALPSGNNLIGTVGMTGSLPSGSNIVGTVTAIASNETSTIYNGVTALTPLFSKISFAGIGNNVIVGTVSAKRIRVVAMSFLVSTATALYLGDSNGAFLWGNSTNAGSFAASSGIVLPYCPVGYFQTGSGNALIANLSASSQVAGSLTYLTI